MRAVFVAALVASCAHAASTSPSTRTSTTIGDEWASSFHRTAFTNPTYQESLALEEPKEHAFCNGCHAPASDRTAGVDCATCHQAKVAARDTCRTCHEFSFPDRAELVQKTFTEHAASDFADVACIECHMPKRDAHRDHRFLGGHSPERISRALHVDVNRTEGNRMRVAIRVDAGHFFPTGDMFRRARLVVFAERADGAIVADAERLFGRTWTSRADGARTEANDTRIRGSWSEEIPLDAASPIARVRWSLIYERVVSVRPPHINLASSDVLASGDLAWN
jgi:hypothetical protein